MIKLLDDSLGFPLNNYTYLSQCRTRLSCHIEGFIDCLTQQSFTLSFSPQHGKGVV